MDPVRIDDELMRRRIRARLLGEPIAPLALGHLKVRRVLGRGGMGEVYEAEDPHRGTHVAVKVLHPDRAPLGLHKEFAAMERLRHPNLVALYELHRVDGRTFFTMEYVDGQSVNAYLAGPGDRSWKIEHLAGQLFGALRHLMRHGYVHGDIKPANMVVTATGRLVLLDLGLATRVENSRDFMGGTLSYLPPELLRGEPCPGYQRDHYAAALCVYEWLTDAPAFADTRSSGVAPPDVATLHAEKSRDRPELAPQIHQRHPALAAFAEQGARAEPGARAQLPQEADVRDHAYVRSDDVGARVLGMLEGASPTIVWIRGEAGIGKSALVRACMRESKGRVVLTSPSPRHDTAWRWVSAWLAVGADQDPEAAAAGARALDGSATSAELRQVIGTLSEDFKAGDTLVVDEAHWLSDEDHAHLRFAALKILQHGAHVVVCTRERDEAIADLCARAQGQGFARQELALRPLSTSDSLEVLRRVRHDQPGTFAEPHARISEGRPALLQLVAQECDGDVGIQDLAALLSTKPEPLKEVVKLLSIAAAPIPLPVLLAMMPRRSAADVEDAAARGWLSLETRHGESIVGVAHPEIGSQVAAATSIAEATPLHRELARHLLALPDADPLLVVRHLEASQQAERARSVATSAARAAERSGDWIRAARMWEAAARSDPDQPRVWVAAARCLDNATAPLAAARMYERASVTKSGTSERWNVEAAARYVDAGWTVEAKHVLASTPASEYTDRLRWALRFADPSRRSRGDATPENFPSALRAWARGEVQLYAGDVDVRAAAQPERIALEWADVDAAIRRGEWAEALAAMPPFLERCRRIGHRRYARECEFLRWGLLALDAEDVLAPNATSPRTEAFSVRIAALRAGSWAACAHNPGEAWRTIQPLWREVRGALRHAHPLLRHDALVAAARARLASGHRLAARRLAARVAALPLVCAASSSASIRARLIASAGTQGKSEGARGGGLEHPALLGLPP